jgi:hypothetical protein
MLHLFLYLVTMWETYFRVNLPLNYDVHLTFNCVLVLGLWLEMRTCLCFTIILANTQGPTIFSLKCMLCSTDLRTKSGLHPTLVLCPRQKSGISRISFLVHHSSVWSLNRRMTTWRQTYAWYLHRRYCNFRWHKVVQLLFLNTDTAFIGLCQANCCR